MCRCHGQHTGFTGSTNSIKQSGQDRRHRKRGVADGLSLYSFFRVWQNSDYVLDLTIQYLAQLFQCVGRDRFVVLQVVYSPGVDVVIVNKRICADATLLHCLP